MGTWEEIVSMERPGKYQALTNRRADELLVLLAARPAYWMRRLEG